VSQVRAAFLLLIGFGIVRQGHAHEFWVQPSEFQMASGAAISVSLQVGDGPTRQPSPIPLHRITRFDAAGPSGESIDLRASLAATVKHDIRFDAPGIYVLTLATDNRAHSHRERYSRAAKSIVQVGSVNGQSQATVTKPLGLQRTDHTGLATFSMPAGGSWLISVVWTQRVENSPDADFETIFASLTFGSVPGSDRTSR
jgi:hypothetical protein